MESLFNKPSEIIDANINGEITKANLPALKMTLLGILAGAFIAIGGMASNVAVHNISNVGIARTLAGAIFPVGLMLVVLVGGELFTGNCLMIMANIDKKIKVSQICRNLVIVYFANLVGALVIDVLVLFSGQLDFTGGALGAYTIKVAYGKVSLSALKEVSSGILCNILVCLAVLMASAAKDVGGKIWAIFFPIWAFVIGGFEHCVANMFYIPMGMLASSNPLYVQKANELYGLTESSINTLFSFATAKSFIFVTIGNILGGMIFVGLICYYAQKSKK